MSSPPVASEGTEVAVEPEQATSGTPVRRLIVTAGYVVAALLAALFVIDFGAIAEEGVTLPVFVPPFLYLFAFAGALTYVSLSVVADPVLDVNRGVRLVARVLVALLLVTGVYVVGVHLQWLPEAGAADADRELAGVAFLVGLFIKHAIAALSSVSERLYPGDPQELFGDSRKG